MSALSQLGLGPLALGGPGRGLLQLGLGLLPAVLRLALGLLQALHLAAQLLVAALQAALALLQVGLELHTHAPAGQQGSVWCGGGGRRFCEALEREVPVYPLGLLQLLGQLLQGGAVPLPHLLDLGLVVLGFFVDGLLELGHLLLALGPAVGRKL